jgi:hypothetical protein
MKEKHIKYLNNKLKNTILPNSLSIFNALLDKFIYRVSKLELDLACDKFEAEVPLIICYFGYSSFTILLIFVYI